MLNWIDKNERLPTKEDAHDGYVYVVYKGKEVGLRLFSRVGGVHLKVTHWLPFREMPIPKRWRPATIHDLAKAGKPIPCRVRHEEGDQWQDGKLAAMSVMHDDDYPFYTNNEWWKFCEVEDA